MPQTDIFTVITTMKNEGPFLLEWVAHHKALGFDHLVICTNDCEDTTTEMVVRLQKLGLVRAHETRCRPGQSIHRRALRQAMTYDEVQRADWIYLCGADEFLATRLGDGSVRALVAAASPDVDAISVSLRPIGRTGKDAGEGPITGQVALADATSGLQHQTQRSLVRATRLPHLLPPGLAAPPPQADPSRDIRVELPGGIAFRDGSAQPQGPADYRHAQVNHYAIRSPDGLPVKTASGTEKRHHGTDVDDRLDNRDGEACDLIRRYDEEADLWLGLLLEDRRLNTLHQRAIRWHRTRTADVRANPEAA